VVESLWWLWMVFAQCADRDHSVAMLSQLKGLGLGSLGGIWGYFSSRRKYLIYNQSITWKWESLTGSDADIDCFGWVCLGPAGIGGTIRI
jgi:hypothetical protein